LTTAIPLVATLALMPRNPIVPSSAESAWSICSVASPWPGDLIHLLGESVQS
jgi:hypothetical protein